MRSRSWYLGLLVVALVYAHNTLPYLTMLPRVNVDEPWLMERAYQVMKTGIPSQPMLGLQHAYLLQVGYGYVLAIWMTIAGVGLFQARLLAVLMGFGIVLMTAAIGRRTLDPFVGLFAALLLALDSNALGGMRSARTDIPSVFFVVCAFAAYVRGHRLSRSAWFAAAGASLGVAMLCHGNAFWAGIIVLAWFVIDFGSRALTVPFGYAMAGGWLLTCGPYLAIVVARWSDVQVQIGNFAADRVPGWRASFVLQQMQREAERYKGWYFGLITADLPNPLLRVFQALIVVGLAVLIVRTVRSGPPGASADPRGALKLLTLAAGAAVIFAGFINNKVPVYLPHILFGFSLAAGVAVSAALRLVSGSTRSTVAVGILIAYGAAGIAYYEKWYARERKSELVPYESTDRTLRAIVPGGPKIIFASPQFWTTFHAEPETAFLSFAAAQPTESEGAVALAGARADRLLVLVVDEYQWLPELIGVSSSPPAWQRDWIRFIEQRCAVYAVAYGTAHGTLATYECALGTSSVDTLRPGPKIVGGSTEYRAEPPLLEADAAALSSWPRYVDPRRTATQIGEVTLAKEGLRIRGSGWPGIETQFTAEPGSTYIVRPATRSTREGDLLYLGGWEQPQVQSLSGASSAGIPAQLIAPEWFPHDRAFRATDTAVRLRIYSEAPQTNFLISSLQIARLQPVR